MVNFFVNLTRLKNAWIAGKILCLGVSVRMFFGKRLAFEFID